MSKRIIRIAALAAVALALLLGGCDPVGGLEPESDGTAIAFSAGSKLLRDNVMTKATTDSFTSTDPENPDTFSVFGERVNSADEHILVFDNVTITHHYALAGEPPAVVENYWDYTSPKRYWYWLSTSDRYDFVAVSPAGKGTVNEHAVGNLSVSTHYNYDNPNGNNPEGGDKYDILAATYRRRGVNWERRHEQVDLAFSHMGSAVGVKVVNNSSHTDITVTSLYYKNLIVSADAKVSMDNLGQSSLWWANPTPSAAIVRQLTKENPTVIRYGEEYTGEYQIMIPQDLTTFNAQLYLTYRVGNDPHVYTSDPPIQLSNIKRTNDTAITSWEIGYKYTYTVSVRLDGGLLVTVTTTPWDVPVQGETPGILI